MFNECDSLMSIPNISNWKTDEIKFMWYLFNKCSSLISLPDISNWNTSNVTSMENIVLWMFIINIFT